MTYLNLQEMKMKQHIANLREFQCAAMLRGSYTYTRNGDGLLHAFSGGAYTVNYQIPASNLTTLNMLGSGAIIDALWSNAATLIVTHLEKINDAFYKTYGNGLTDVVVSPIVWGYIRSNTEVKNTAGTSNAPFEMLTIDPEQRYWIGTLRAIPGVRFHIIGYRLNLNGTATEVIPNDRASFLSLGDPEQCDIAECTEMVAEQYGMPMVPRAGEYYWIRTEIDPAKYVLHAQSNSIPRLFQNLSLAWGSVA